MPAIGEGLPRIRHLFDLEFTKVGLEELLLVVAELHVKVAIEAAFWCLIFVRFQRTDALMEGEV